MMIDIEELKQNIIKLAVCGKLTAQNEEEDVEEYLKKCFEFTHIQHNLYFDAPFEIPDNWEWMRLEEMASFKLGKTPERGNAEWWEGTIPWITISDMADKRVIISTKECVTETALSNYFGDMVSKKGTLIMSFKLTVGRVSILGIDAVHNEAIISIYPYGDSNNIIRDYLKYIIGFMTRYCRKADAVKGVTLNKEKLKNLLIPIPPLEEQKRIVDKLDEIFAELDKIDEKQTRLATIQEKMEAKILKLAIQGKLVEQRPEEGTGEELYNSFNLNVFDDIKSEEIPFDLPNNYKWIRLGWVMDIERGGSPRPIKSYITDSEDGINWIKIGDVDKGGKYIYSTMQKIKPEGEQKSRRVYPGDFLLTNSMSFGRPYISKITGCIHDGWLLLRNSCNAFNLDYLYLLLSSSYAYEQFSKKASGATVDNLNKDKVFESLVPLPPLEEQKRIVAKIEELLPLCKG